MARGLVQTRIELEQQTDAGMREIMACERRKSKRDMMKVLLERVDRLWRKSPQESLRLGLVKPEERDGQLLQKPA